MIFAVDARAIEDADVVSDDVETVALKDVTIELEADVATCSSVDAIVCTIVTCEVGGNV